MVDFCPERAQRVEGALFIPYQYPYLEGASRLRGLAPFPVESVSLNRVLCSPFSLIAQRVFRNSFPIKTFRTLSRRLPGVPQLFPFWNQFSPSEAEGPRAASFLSLPHPRGRHPFGRKLTHALAEQHSAEL